MKLSPSDRMFIMAVLGTIVLTVLVFIDKASVETLVAWLGGAGTASVGRLFEPKKDDKDAAR